jgi:uncharacterized membrane protein YbhN (UPF0104 family)
VGHLSANSAPSATTDDGTTGTVRDVTDPVVLGPTSGADDHAAPPAAPMAAPLRRFTGRILTVVIALAALVAAWRLRGTLGDAFGAVAGLDAATIGVLVGCWLALVVARAAVYRFAHPRSTMAHGLVLDQVNLATGNALPAGMVVGCAARYRVGRSFGQTPDGIALTMFAAGQAFSLGRWLLVAVVVGRTLLVGHGTEVDTVAFASAVTALVAAGGIWAVIAHDTRLSRWAVGRAQSTLDRLGRRFGRVRDVPVVPFVDGVRHGARRLLREQGWRMVLTGALAGLAGAVIVVVVVRAVDGAAAPDAWDILRAYLLARIATSFVPTPGNVGALEGAMTAGLVASGAGLPAAAAAVLVYRGLTFVLPIATGAAAYVGWRRWDRLQAG